MGEALCNLPTLMARHAGYAQMDANGGCCRPRSSSDKEEVRLAELRFHPRQLPSDIPPVTAKRQVLMVYRGRSQSHAKGSTLTNTLALPAAVLLPTQTLQTLQRWSTARLLRNTAQAAAERGPC